MMFQLRLTGVAIRSRWSARAIIPSPVSHLAHTNQVERDRQANLATALHTNRAGSDTPGGSFQAARYCHRVVDNIGPVRRVKDQSKFSSSTLELWTAGRWPNVLQGDLSKRGARTSLIARADREVDAWSAFELTAIRVRAPLKILIKVGRLTFSAHE
jgi:hypothetical protein